MSWRNETEYTNALLRELKKIPYTYWWRNNVGRRGGVSFGDRNSPDIEGILRGGRFVGIECKEYGEEPTDGQTEWHTRAINLGAAIFVARMTPIDEVIRWVVVQIEDPRKYSAR